LILIGARSTVVTPADLITAIVTESRMIEPAGFEQVVRVPAMRAVPVR
jgi:methylthioribose-1-phosphate isomerase